MLTLYTATKRGETVKEIIKHNIKYILFLTICGLVGGYFTALYSIQNISPDLLAEAISQVGSIEIVIIISTIQSLGYSLILGIIGKILAKKIGLWRKLEFTKKPIIEILIVTIFGGIAFIMADHLFFNNLQITIYFLFYFCRGCNCLYCISKIF